MKGKRDRHRDREKRFMEMREKKDRRTLLGHKERNSSSLESGSNNSEENSVGERYLDLVHANYFNINAEVNSGIFHCIRDVCRFIFVAYVRSNSMHNA